MNTLSSHPFRAPLCRCCLLLAALACAGCQPVALKTLDLPPTSIPTGSTGFQGSKGFCLIAATVPPTGFSPGPGEFMVGFDNFFRAGSEPFPCDDFRSLVFRGGAFFDVSQFDSVVTATLLFDTVRSAQRAGGVNLGTTTPKSFATMVGVATAPFSSKMNCTADAPLPAGPNINIGVSGQVKDWVSGSRPNFGFVIWGPRDPPNTSNPPRDNDAAVSWYTNARLRIVYAPKQNPRAPQ